MTEPVSLTIDGAQVTSEPGRMVLEVANEAGIYVPYLCYHPGMKPFAACRMCVVEVEGGRGLPASCTLPVQNGMVVHTDTPGVQAVRQEIMEMLTAEHPHGCLTCHRVDLCGPQDICLRHVAVNDRCVTCPKNERCELKDTTRYVGVAIESPLDYKYRDLPIETGDPFYDRDYNLCIVCGRCVRACEEIRGDNAITFVERAGKALVGTSHGASLLESGCEFCGACLDVCPVGALVERDHKWEKASRVVRTICPHCPVGCQLNLELSSSDKLIRVVPELNSPANRGQACFKGKFGLEYVNHTERLRTPLIRRDGQLVAATWGEALDLVAQRLATYRDGSFALLMAPDGTNEEHYLAQKFARVAMGTNSVDQTCNIYPEIADAQLASLSVAAATNSIWNLEDARCVLVFASNTTEEHNVLALPIKKAIKAGASLVVVDPREVELTRYASTNLRPAPGTELLLLGGLLKAVVSEGLVQEQWLSEHCDSPRALLDGAMAVDQDAVSRETGVPVYQIEEAARAFASASPSAIVYSLDNIDQELRADCIQALAGLAMLTGSLGAPGVCLYPLRPGANSQGAWDVGSVPHLLPGYQPVQNEAARRRLGELWGKSLPQEPGVALSQLAAAVADGRVKAMLVIGDGSDLPDGELAGSAGLEFLVVQDSFLGEIASRADVVLPRATFAEKDGTYTSLERRIQLLRPAVPLEDGGAQPESWVLCQLAQRMGVSGFVYETQGQVMDEIAQAAPQYGGVSHQRLVSQARWVARPDPSNPAPTQVLYSDKEYPGLQWPCPEPTHPGTLNLHAEAGWKGRPVVPHFRKGRDARQEEYPLLLVPGRLLLQSEQHIDIKAGRQNHIVRVELADLAQADADAMGIAEGDSIEVVTASTRFAAHARIRAEVPQGSVFSTSLFGQLMTDIQASDHPRPMSALAGLAIVPARVEKVADNNQTS